MLKASRKANLRTKKTGRITLDDKQSEPDHRELRIDKGEMAGTAAVDVTTNPPLKGTPCHATYGITGKRL